MVSVRNTWDHDSPFGMHTRNKMSVKAKASKTNDKMHVVHLHIQTAGHCGLVTLMALAQPSILDISKRNLRRKMDDGMTCIETWFKREQGVGWGGGGGGFERELHNLSNLFSHPKFIWIQQQSRFKTVKDQRWDRMQ